MKKCRFYTQKGASYTHQQERRQTGEVKTWVGKAYSEKINIIEGKIEEKAKGTR
jgi:hypothetical protein